MQLLSFLNCLPSVFCFSANQEVRFPPEEFAQADVKIVDRRRLEEAACDCYGIMQRQIEDWQGDSQ